MGYVMLFGIGEISDSTKSIRINHYTQKLDNVVYHITIFTSGYGRVILTDSGRLQPHLLHNFKVAYGCKMIP